MIDELIAGSIENHMVVEDGLPARLYLDLKPGEKHLFASRTYSNEGISSVLASKGFLVQGVTIEGSFLPQYELIKGEHAKTYVTLETHEEYPRKDGLHPHHIVTFGRLEEYARDMHGAICTALHAPGRDIYPGDRHTKAELLRFLLFHPRET